MLRIESGKLCIAKQVCSITWALVLLQNPIQLSFPLSHSFWGCLGQSLLSVPICGSRDLSEHLSEILCLDMLREWIIHANSRLYHWLPGTFVRSPVTYRLILIWTLCTTKNSWFFSVVSQLHSLSRNKVKAGTGLCQRLGKREGRRKQWGGGRNVEAQGNRKVLSEQKQKGRKTDT